MPISWAVSVFTKAYQNDPAVQADVKRSLGDQGSVFPSSEQKQDVMVTVSICMRLVMLHHYAAVIGC